MVAELPDGFGRTWIARDDGASVAAGSEVFRGIEAKAGGVAYGSNSSAVVAGAVGLGRVFNHSQLIAPGNLEHLVHVRWLAVQMDRDDRFGSRRNAIFDSFDVDGVGLRINVHKDGRRPGMHDRLSRGNEAVAGGNHFVAWPNTQSS